MKYIEFLNELKNVDKKNQNIEYFGKKRFLPQIYQNIIDKTNKIPKDNNNP